MKTTPLDPEECVRWVQSDYWVQRVRADLSGCVIWTGPTKSGQYPRGVFAGKFRSPTRIAWVAAQGRDVRDQCVIRHACNQGLCVNPEHLVELLESEKVDSPRGCSVPGCTQGHYGRGYCNMHYQRWRRSSEALGTPAALVTWGLSLEERLARNAEREGDCLIWRTKHGGRARVTLDGRVVTVARVVWEAKHGAVPRGAHVLHTCANELCVEVDHLYVGSRSDNMRDRARDGNAPTQRLTPEDVRAIRASFERNVDLAAKYNVSDAAISNIRTGRTWVWLD